MKNKFLGILLVLIICINAGAFVTFSQGLEEKPDVTAFSYTLLDREGQVDTEITSGGTVKVDLTLENNTASAQPYTVIMQILNNGEKVSVKSEDGIIDSTLSEDISLSYVFSSAETDFSKYSVEVYVWSDMESMQPISTYSVLGSDNNDIYAYKIDGNLVYTKNSTSLTHYFEKDYTGVPRIFPIFYDLATKYSRVPSSAEVTTVKKNINFKTVSQLGSIKDYYLQVYKITEETDPKNADLKSASLQMGAYNSNYNMISNLYPAFNKDTTEYTIYTYSKSYISVPIDFATVNSDATVSLTTAPDTTASRTSAVYTVTSADGTTTKDYTFNYIVNNGTNRLGLTNVANIYKRTSGTCLAEWNGHALTQTNKIYLQDGIYVRSATDLRTIKTTNAIIEIDISTVPDTIGHGVLRLALGNTYPQAKKPGTLRLHKINDAVYNLASINTITASDLATYFGDEICNVTVNPLSANNADMYIINIGTDYVEAAKAAGRTKLYIGLAGETTDPENGFSAVFGGTATDLSKYTASLFEYIVE